MGKDGEKQIFLLNRMKRVFPAVCMPIVVALLGKQLPFQNPDLSLEERAKDLISRLTLDEKSGYNV